jgi:hypothetical protein
MGPGGQRSGQALKFREVESFYGVREKKFPSHAGSFFRKDKVSCIFPEAASPRNFLFSFPVRGIQIFHQKA